jgi:hypothetical protein
MSDAASLTVRVPLRIGRKAGQRTVVIPVQTEGDNTVRTIADPALVKALARAFRYQKLLDKGEYASITEMAAAEKIERGYLGTLLRMTLLAPEVVETILDGLDLDRIALPTLLQPFPINWSEQLALSHRRPGSDLPAT